MCVRKCPALQPEPEHYDELKEKAIAYGAWHRTFSIHKTSSSGGIFTALAKMVIDAGGCVFGVRWTDPLTASYDKAETLAEVEPMRGSKYTMAHVGSTYRQIKKELTKGRCVLFVGTPCQVNALKSYLNKPYTNLLTVDIVCHGIPSHLLLRKYVDETETLTAKKISRINFRDKRSQWIRYNLTHQYTDDTEDTWWYKQTSYMKLFLSDIAMNKCCYSCRYAHYPRQGDLTLGDFWGVWNHHKDWPLNTGVAALLVHTPAGEAAVRKIEPDVHLKSIPSREIYDGQLSNFVRPAHSIPAQRAAFFKDLPRMSTAALVQRYVALPDRETPPLLHPIPRDLDYFLMKLFKWFKKH